MSIKKKILKRSVRKANRKSIMQDLNLYETALKGCISDCFEFDDWSLEAVNFYITRAFADIRKHWKIPCEISNRGATATWLYKVLQLDLCRAREQEKLGMTTKFSAWEITTASAVLCDLFDRLYTAGGEPFQEFREPKAMEDWKNLHEERDPSFLETAPDAATMEAVSRLNAALRRNK